MNPPTTLHTEQLNNKMETSATTNTGHNSVSKNQDNIMGENSSKSSSPEETAVHIKRRPRRSYNCGPCKKQKIKCDTQTPCGACKRHNRTDQCLASPPNPPSPDHKKRIKKISLSLGEPVNIKPMNQHQVHNNSSPVGVLPSTASRNSPDFKLPSLQAYTSSFKINSGGFEAPRDNLIPLGQRMQQLSTDTSPYLASKENSISQIPRPWDRSSTSPGYNSSNSLFKPIKSEHDEVYQLRSQISLLTSRLTSLETKLESLDQKKSMKLAIDDNVFEYLSTIPHQVSINDASENSKSINIKFLQPDKLDNWDDFVQVIPDNLALSNIAQFFKLYLNPPMNLIDAKTLDYCFDSQKLVKGKSLVTQEDWECLSLVAMVCSLTVLSYPQDSIESHLNIKRTNALYVSNTLFQISKNCLNIVKYRENPKLIHLQILLLCSNYLKVFNKKNLLITTNSEMVSIAYTLGLQSLIIPQNSLEVETSQKIWWIICLNDTLNSLKFQIPPLIRLENLPKAQIGGSHILKAFISAEVSSFNSIITYIAKITKICNEIPLVSKQTTVEYVESLVIIDRQLTSLQIPHSFSLLNPRNDIVSNFQSCYLHFVLVLSRFEIYKKIYFTSQNSSIWLIMVSVLESFFKRYTELKKMYPPKDHLNNYLQISDHLIISAITNLLISISDPEILPRGYKQIIHSYFDSILEDLHLLRLSVLNDTTPFYNQSFKIIQRLSSVYQLQESRSLSAEVSAQIEESQKKQLEVSSKLKDSRVFESQESELGLVPSNEFFNIFLTSLYQEQRNSQQRSVTNEAWSLKDVLDNDQISFLRCIGIC